MGGTSIINARCGVVADLDILRLSTVNATPSATATVSRFRLTRRKEPRSLAANVHRGAIWSFAGTIILKFSSVGTTAIVARILSPHDFGVFAVAMTVFTIVTALGEFGVTSCLARADLDVESLAPTLWSVSRHRACLWPACSTSSPRRSQPGLGSPDAAHPVQVMSIVMVIWGISRSPDGPVRTGFQGRCALPG